MGCNVINSQGLGQYVSGFPCPYDSVLDPGSQLQPIMQAMDMPGLGVYLPAQLALYPQMVQAKGLGCNCARGMGAFSMDGTGLLGTGLFSGGTDLSTWGVGEWLVIAFGVYAASSFVGDTKRGYSRVSKGIRRRRKAVAA